MYPYNSTYYLTGHVREHFEVYANSVRTHLDQWVWIQGQEARFRAFRVYGPGLGFGVQGSGLRVGVGIELRLRLEDVSIGTPHLQDPLPLV